MNMLLETFEAMIALQPDVLHTRPPFSNLFPMHRLDAITEDMKRNGFDHSKPIDVWDVDGDQCHLIVIDGHTRQRSAIQAGLDLVPVFVHQFVSEEDALAYAVKCQRNRRNLTDADILRVVATLDERKKAGRPEKLAQSCANSETGKSAETTAVVIGISPRKVEQVRTVLNHAPEDIKAAVQDGGMTINKAYTETQERRKAPKENAVTKSIQAVYPDRERKAEEMTTLSIRCSKSASSLWKDRAKGNETEIFGSLMHILAVCPSIEHLSMMAEIAQETLPAVSAFDE